MIYQSPKEIACNYLRAMLGPQASFRPGQWEAIETVAIHKKRALVVQRTGWGKSLVYFLATKLLQETHDYFRLTGFTIAFLQSRFAI